VANGESPTRPFSAAAPLEKTSRIVNLARSPLSALAHRRELTVTESPSAPDSVKTAAPGIRSTRLVGIALLHLRAISTMAEAHPLEERTSFRAYESSSRALDDIVDMFKQYDDQHLSTCIVNTEPEVQLAAHAEISRRLQNISKPLSKHYRKDQKLRRINIDTARAEGSLFARLCRTFPDGSSLDEIFSNQAHRRATNEYKRLFEELHAPSPTEGRLWGYKTFIALHVALRLKRNLFSSFNQVVSLPETYILSLSG